MAEKFQAMVYLGTLNSRMKDFYDIWLLARQFEFAGVELAAAIEKTFRNRGTQLDTDPIALTVEFTQAESAMAQWTAFVNRSRLESAPATLDQLREPLRAFLLPITEAIDDGRVPNDIWPASGPWRPR